MNKILLFGAGEYGKKAMDFLKFSNLDSYVYGFCDNDQSKIGNKYIDKPIFSYNQSKELNLPFVITVSPAYYSEIESQLQQDDVKYYDDVVRCLHLECGVDMTQMNRSFCAYYHLTTMDAYFDRAETNLESFWCDNSVFFRMFNQLDLTSVIELACGRGRHVQKYIDKSGQIVLVDILEKNIDICKERFKDRSNIRFYRNNGYDLSELNDGEYTALFTYDSMVHFEMFDIYNYLVETFRVLKSGGKALFHHSNSMISYDQSFRNPHNIHGRSFMSKDLFAYLAYKAGFDILDQQVIDWSTSQALDCLSLVQKP